VVDIKCWRHCHTCHVFLLYSISWCRFCKQTSKHCWRGINGACVLVQRYPVHFVSLRFINITEAESSTDMYERLSLCQFEIILVHASIKLAVHVGFIVECSGLISLLHSSIKKAWDQGLGGGVGRGRIFL